MHDLALRAEVRRLAQTGRTPSQIARCLALPHTTVHRWVTRHLPTDARPPSACFVCEDATPAPETARPYAYLLGQYLGDGHLVTKARAPVLRLYCCTDYPAIIDEVCDAIEAVRRRRPARMRLASTERAMTVQSFWMHWPCLVPQHGPGRKHERPIVLADWQRDLVEQHPWSLIRGLIHSDGCRAINRVTVRGVPYAYPRYFFANESRDILQVMGDALDRVRVAWRYNRPNSISIARREAVAAMDAHVGPKR